MSQKLELHSAYNPRRIAVIQDVGGDSLTRQEFVDECDVNALMKRYDKVGVWPMSDAREPAYLDCSDIPDLRTAYDAIRDAEAAFMSLPASVRRTFENDPAQFVDFASDPKNIDQMREWKLAPAAPEEPAPTKVEIVGGAAPPAQKPVQGD